MPVPVYVTWVDWSRILAGGHPTLELLKEREKRILRVSPSLYSYILPQSFYLFTKLF